MLERVYGRQTPEQLAAIMARAMGLAPADCSRVVAAALETADSTHQVDTTALPRPRRRAPKTIEPAKLFSLAGPDVRAEMRWCLGAESNHRYGDFQSPRQSPQGCDFTPFRPAFAGAGSGWVREE